MVLITLIICMVVQWYFHSGDGLAASQRLAFDTALAAKDQDDAPNHIIVLVESASLVWIVAIALFTLGALIS